jgi:hypothetical protein
VGRRDAQPQNAAVLQLIAQRNSIEDAISISGTVAIQAGSSNTGSPSFAVGLSIVSVGFGVALEASGITQAQSDPSAVHVHALVRSAPRAEIHE